MFETCPSFPGGKNEHTILDSALGQGCAVAITRSDFSQGLACDHPIRCPERVGSPSWRPCLAAIPTTSP
jgi:hypothetical protein